MANFKDFAVGLVGTTGAPSPATTGTSITLRAGDGVSMPTPPFYVTATPPGQLTTLGTSEKLLVTAVSGDTLTVVRAQDGTTAKSIAANWIIANAMYAQDVTASSIKMDELMTGTVNGTNKVFTTASAFTALIVYKNGVTLHVGDDYTITGTNQITMVTAPTTGTKLTATYILGTNVMISGSNGMITHETPAGAVNGTNAVFTTARPYISGSLQVYINGLRQSAAAAHYAETSSTAGTFTLADAPSTGDIIGVQYQFVSTVSGNADTVDGNHDFDLMPVGAGMDFWGTTLPSGKWLFAAGQAISRTTYSALFALIGTTYGAGDGSTTFNIPDKRGRVTAALDNMGGTAANRLNTPAAGGITATTLGATGGEQSHVQTQAELATHTHVPARQGYTTSGQNGDAYQFANLHAEGYGPAGGLQAAGSSAAANITQPTIACNYIIKVA